MKLTILLISVVTSGLIVFGCGPMFGKNTELPSPTLRISRKLKVSVALEKSELRLSDKCKMVVTIRNVGDIPVYLYKRLGWGGSSSLSYRIEDSSGQEVEKTLISDSRDHPPYDVSDFEKLETNDTIKTERWLDVYTEGILKPGDYKLYLIYHSPISAESAPKDIKVWTSQDGNLVAEPVQFRVTR